MELNSIERYMLHLGVAWIKLSDSQADRASFYFSLNVSKFVVQQTHLQYVNENILNENILPECVYCISFSGNYINLYTDLYFWRNKLLIGDLTQKLP